MATNKPYGDGHRHGAVKTRSQLYNDKIERFKFPECYFGSYQMEKNVWVLSGFKKGIS